MKRLTIYAISFLSLSVILTTCYFASYRYADKKFSRRQTESGQAASNFTGTGSQNVLAGAKKIVAVDASYVEQVYDMATDKLKEKKKNIPNDFVGLTREEVIACLNHDLTNKSLDEFNKGLVDCKLVSFSPDKVVVKKTYNSKGIMYKYFMTVRDNEVVVYYSDKKTIYDDETGINLDEMPAEEQRALFYGKWIKDDNELYSLIESYTS